MPSAGCLADSSRLTRIDYADKTVTFTYDSRGHLAGYDDGTTSATYAYDGAGRKISASVDYDPFTRTNTTLPKK